jgi:hypothetical protein
MLPGSRWWDIIIPLRGRDKDAFSMTQLSGGTNLEDKGPLGGGDIAGSGISESRNRNTRREPPERQHCAITHHSGYVGTVSAW